MSLRTSKWWLEKTISKILCLISLECAYYINCQAFATQDHLLPLLASWKSLSRTCKLILKTDLDALQLMQEMWGALEARGQPALQELKEDGALLEGAGEAGRIQLLRNEPSGSFSYIKRLRKQQGP